jgi:hypothetical protein
MEPLRYARWRAFLPAAMAAMAAVQGRKCKNALELRCVRGSRTNSAGSEFLRWRFHTAWTLSRSWYDWCNYIKRLLLPGNAD